MEGKYKIILLALFLGAFMTSLDGTIVSVALPTMAKELGEEGHNTSGIAWVLLIYTLMLCCFILLWSKLGTNIGYKKVFVSGIAIFTISSLAIGLCGLFPGLGLGAIVLLRGVQGLGAGMAIAMSLAMVSAYLPADATGRGVGLVILASSLGMACGPAVGGILTSFHWSYIFFINIPIGLFCILLCAKYMKVESNVPSEKKKLDYIGTALMFFMMMSLIMYLNKGSELGWRSDVEIALLIVVFVCGGLLAWWEPKSADPLLSIRMIKERNISRSNIVAMLIFMAMCGSYLLLPYYMQYVMGLSTMQYGFLLIANSLGIMLTGPLAGKIADRTGNNRNLILAGLAIGIAGFYMMMRFGMTTGVPYVAISLFVMGAGLGMALVASTNIAFEYKEAGEDGQMSGLINTFRQAGSSAGVAIIEAVFTAGIGAASLGAAALIPGFHDAFFIAIVFLLFALMIAFTLEDKPAN